jgi:hypothetical protein
MYIRIAPSTLVYPMVATTFSRSSMMSAGKRNVISRKGRSLGSLGFTRAMGDFDD